MAIMLNHHLWTLVFGILGNVISVLVYLAPMPTFYRIYKKKSTESFQSLPYQVALLCCMLWLYYALLRQKAVLLITINTFGCVVETLYISIYVAYASKDKRVSAIKLFVATNVVAFPCVLLLTRFLLNDVKSRDAVLGWMCVAVSIGVYAAPLNVVARVVRTRSVEYMPFTLSLFLTINAVLWFAYGLLLRDIFVALPNIAGFFFGTLQMVVYGIYRRISRNATESDEEKQREQKIAVVMSEMNLKETGAGSDVKTEVKEERADDDN